MKRTITWMFVFLLIGSLISCGKTENDTKNTEYIQEINEWHGQRIARLKAKNGWLSLIGLFWLDEGENSMGSAESNDFIIEAAGMPANIGSFTFTDGIIVFKTDQEVKYKGNVIRELTLKDDSDKDYTLLEYESFNWFIIKRGPKYGVRIKNNLDPKIEALKDIKTFKIDSTWKVKAKYKKFPEPKIVKVMDAIGLATDTEIFGKLSFKIKGKDFEIIPFGGGRGGFFLVFGDLTNGKETYGGGRFLSVSKPDENGETIIDFNKAYNPPCVFSEYATCPSPIKQNKLPIKITAGEQMYGESHH